jgi:RNA polymerase sigma-70 factor (ECF subfamily)
MDRDLVERAMAGDHEAFSVLAKASVDRLFAVARLILRDHERAEDATQEALVAAWRDLPALRDPERFEAWLHRLVVRACYREARRHRRRQEVEIHELAVERSEPDRSLLLADRDALERGFARLDADQRAVLVLHHYVGFPVPEIADVLGVPVGTVKSRIFRATQAMRAALAADATSTRLTEGRIG